MATASDALNNRNTKMLSYALTLCALAGALLAAGPALAGRASLDMADIPDDVRALMAKERSRAYATGAAQKDEQEKTANNAVSSGRKGGCNMDMGNVASRPGQINSKPAPVIVTGPVVQMCR